MGGFPGGAGGLGGITGGRSGSGGSLIGGLMGGFCMAWTPQCYGQMKFLFVETFLSNGFVVY